MNSYDHATEEVQVSRHRGLVVRGMGWGWGGRTECLGGSGWEAEQGVRENFPYHEEISIIEPPPPTIGCGTCSVGVAGSTAGKG